jgi:acyl-coenzyme A thioesterase PaaI-like protein
MGSAARLIGVWQRLSAWPGGRFLFGRLIAFAIPYTGSMRAEVLEVRPGYARVQLRDRRRVRNHLNSIHAIALTNLGEFTGGPAMTAALPPDVRSILLKLEIEFLKKARGTVQAECSCSPPSVSAPTDYIVATSVRNAQQEEVARVTATWRLSRV